MNDTESSSPHYLVAIDANWQLQRQPFPLRLALYSHLVAQGLYNVYLRNADENGERLERFDLVEDEDIEHVNLIPEAQALREERGFQREDRRRRETLEEVLDAPSYSTQSISTDKRRTKERTYAVDLRSPLKKTRRVEVPFSDVGDAFEYVFEALEPPPRVVPQNRAVRTRAKQYLSSDTPLAQWVPLRDKYLAELLRLEGRGCVADDVCQACPNRENAMLDPAHRCVDCLFPELVCASCCLRHHQDRPLDRIECWTGRFFEHVTLKSLGLRVQLGHARGDPCRNPVPGHQSFTVLHSNGLHPVAVDFCACVTGHSPGSRQQQLMRMSWYPSTHAMPQTAATF
ncbi:hypothetical protein DFH09DRAFT_1343354 [Mycena vulgaris]|nr:hypothetical protein DFH09DRAFT_1343354 [Mycena vulgaris]